MNLLNICEYVPCEHWEVRAALCLSVGFAFVFVFYLTFVHPPFCDSTGDV